MWAFSSFSTPSRPPSSTPPSSTSPSSFSWSPSSVEVTQDPDGPWSSLLPKDLLFPSSCLLVWRGSECWQGWGTCSTYSWQHSWGVVGRGQRAGAWTMSTCGSGRWLCLLGIWGEDNILIILSGFIVLKEADKIVVLDCWMLMLSLLKYGVMDHVATLVSFKPVLKQVKYFISELGPWNRLNTINLD